MTSSPPLLSELAKKALLAKMKDNGEIPKQENGTILRFLSFFKRPMPCPADEEESMEDWIAMQQVKASLAATAKVLQMAEDKLEMAKRSFDNKTAENHKDMSNKLSFIIKSQEALLLAQSKLEQKEQVLAEERIAVASAFDEAEEMRILYEQEKIFFVKKNEAWLDKWAELNLKEKGLNEKKLKLNEREAVLLEKEKGLAGGGEGADATAKKREKYANEKIKKLETQLRSAQRKCAIAERRLGKAAMDNAKLAETVAKLKLKGKHNKS